MTSPKEQEQKFSLYAYIYKTLTIDNYLLHNRANINLEKHKKLSHFSIAETAILFSDI
jgi:hypothetical protein